MLTIVITHAGYALTRSQDLLDLVAPRVVGVSPPVGNAGIALHHFCCL